MSRVLTELSFRQQYFPCLKQRNHYINSYSYVEIQFFENAISTFVLILGSQVFRKEILDHSSVTPDIVLQ